MGLCRVWNDHIVDGVDVLGVVYKERIPTATLRLMHSSKKINQFPHSNIIAVYIRKILTLM